MGAPHQQHPGGELTKLRRLLELAREIRRRWEITQIYRREAHVRGPFEPSEDYAAMRAAREAMFEHLRTFTCDGDETGRG